MQLAFIKDKVNSARMQRLIALMSRSEGATNFQLNAVMFRYGAYIFKLRDQGYTVVTTSLGKGLYHYKITGKV